MPYDKSDGLAPLCCGHMQRDALGQLRAAYDGTTKLISEGLCMFRIVAEPEAVIQQNVDGLVVTVEGEVHRVQLHQ